MRPLVSLVIQASVGQAVPGHGDGPRRARRRRRPAPPRLIPASLRGCFLISSLRFPSPASLTGDTSRRARPTKKARPDRGVATSTIARSPAGSSPERGNRPWIGAWSPQLPGLGPTPRPVRALVSWLQRHTFRLSMPCARRVKRHADRHCGYRSLPRRRSLSSVCSRTSTAGGPPMPIEVEVRKRARELAGILHGLRQAHAERRAELMAQLQALDAELSRTDDAEQRLAAFRPMAGSDVLCPYCWMYDKVEHPLLAVERPPDDETYPSVDVLRCEVCGNRYASEPTD